MELEELKAGWNVLNERLAQNEILNKRIIKDMIVTRTNSALSRLKWMNWGGIILVFVMFILVNRCKHQTTRLSHLQSYDKGYGNDDV